MDGKNVPHLQAKFFTLRTQYAITDKPFSVPASIEVPQLSNLINSLLERDDDKKKIEFDFLVDGEFLRVSLAKHMEDKHISTETVVEIEYVERSPAPDPVDSLQHDDWVACVKASGDYILTGCYDNTVQLWNTEGDHIATIPGHGGAVKCAAWIRQEEEGPMHWFVTGSHDETLLIWQWNQMRMAVECVQACRGHAGSVDCVAVDPSRSRFISGSWDKMVKLWSAVPSPEEDVETGDGEKPFKRKKTDGNKIPTRVPLMTLSGHIEGVSAAAWISDTEACTASWDHTIRIWDLEKAEHKSSLGGTKVYLDISYSNINHLVIAASADRHIRLYDPRISDGAVVRCTFTSHTAWVSSVAWSPVDEYLFISGGYDSLLKLWDTRSSKAPLYDMSGHDDKILAVDWSMPQYMLSGGVDNNLKIFKSSEKEFYSNKKHCESMVKIR